jgi:hypothetical protein
MTIDYNASNAQGKENKIVNLGLTKLPFPNITGLTLAADIHLKHPDYEEELTFNTVDANDIVWVITDIQNWWNMPEPEIPDIARGLDDGSYDVRGRWRAKNVTLTGSILVPDASKAPAARQKLMEYANLVYKGGWLIVDEPTYRKAAFVRLAGQPSFENITPRGRINFTIPLRAGDPLKYYWDRADTNGYTYANTITSNTVTNVGNYQVAGVFDITGPITAPAYIVAVDDATDTTQTLTITTSLRDNTYTTPITYTEFSGGSAIITATANPVGGTTHGFLVGDKITVTGVSDTFNVANATVTAVTVSTIAYEKPIANVVSISHIGNVATVTTDVTHGLIGGDPIFIKGNGNPIFDGSYVVTTAPTGTTFTYSKVTANQGTGYGGKLSRQLPNTPVSPEGAVTLSVTDNMKIDTYNNTVVYRGLPDESRSTLAVNVDWIKLKPGASTLTFSKTGGTGTCSFKYRSGWIG